MDVVAATVEGQGAGRDVESSFHRARDVQEERSQRRATLGNHHGRVHGLRADTRLVVQHEGRATEWHRIRRQAQHEQQRARLPARVLVPLRRDCHSLAIGRAQSRSLAVGARDAARSVHVLALEDYR